MSRNKGKKMDLGEFLGQEYGDAKTGHLPRGPRERGEDSGYGGRDDRRRERRDDRIDPNEGRGDMDNQWRKAGGTASASGSYRDRDSRGGDRNGGMDRDRDRDRYDRDSDRNPGPEFGRSEEDSNWRRGPAPAAAGGFGSGETPGRSEGDNNWRRGAGQAPSSSLSRGPRDAEEETDWRRAPRRAREMRDAEYEASEAERPKLNLKKRSDAAAAKNEDAGEKTSDKAAGAEVKDADKDKSVEQDKDKDTSSNGENKSGNAGANKWDNIFKSKSKPSSSSNRRIFDEDDKDRDYVNAFSSGYSKSSRFDRSGDRDAFRSFGSRRRDDDQSYSSFSGSGRYSRDRDRDSREPYTNSRGDSFRDSFRDNRDDRDSYRDSYRDRDRNYGENSRAVEPGAPTASESAYTRADLKKSRESLAAIKRVASWAEDDDDDPDRPRLFGKKPEAKQEDKEKKEANRELSSEDVDSRLQGILKDFFLMNRVSDVVEAVKSKLSLAKAKYEVELIKKAITNAVGETKKEVKLVAKLIRELVERKIVDLGHLAEALNALCKATVDNLKAEKETLKEFGLQMKEVLTQLFSVSEDIKKSELELTEESIQLLGIQSKNNASNPEAKLEEILSSSARGEALSKLVDDLNLKGVESINFGVNLVRKLYESENRTSETSAYDWIQNENYGNLLAKLIYREVPTASEAAAQAEVIFAIQEAFNKDSFPKTQDNKPIIAKVFLLFWKHEILPDEVYSLWKEDTSEREGKSEALQQTKGFIDFLEKEESSEEEDEEDE